MKKAALERNAVIVLFVLVLIIFSFAERDRKKILALYTKEAAAKAHAADHSGTQDSPGKTPARTRH
ncbi:MAG TPA: hypothetical protein VFR58_13355 [Flavisolibacter sp.]|nr:hypothetical protein [Flavisolibacter sp.]